jgi:hypothetical protein
MADEQIAPRRTFLGAKIIFNNRASVIDCVVSILSSSGAKLALAGPTGSQTFELHIPMKSCSYRARLVRRVAPAICAQAAPPTVSRAEPNAAVAKYIALRFIAFLFV